MAMAFFKLHYICLLILSVSPISVVAQTNNVISLGLFLLASQNLSSWKSPSGDFAFGFRLLDNQNLFLLAIWFDKIPEKTVVWYANGDNPAPKGSKIELTIDGQFTLNDPEGKVIWKPESLTNGNGIDHAAMLDTGNFVLASSNSGYMWESFKHPADTILPTQVLEIGGTLSSRQTENNYSKGRFQLRLQVDGNLVLNIALPTNSANRNYYSSGTSDKLNGNNSGYKVIFNEFGYLYVVRRNETIVNLTAGPIVSTTDYYHRETLDSDGIFTQYAHPKAPKNGSFGAQSWFSVWYEPKDICSEMSKIIEYNGVCGFNSLCTLGRYGKPTCQCLPGFSLADPKNNFSACNQERVQKCELGGSPPEELYEILEVPHATWPACSNYAPFPSSNESDCARSCCKDCNCVVAVFRDGTCFKKKLPLANGKVDLNMTGKALIKVPKLDISKEANLSQNSDGGKKYPATLTRAISFSLGTSVFLNFLFVAAISLVVFCSNQKKKKLNRLSSIVETNLRSFTYDDLVKATGGFRDELGKGSFGTVYKGVIISSSNSCNAIAVKKLEKLTQEGEKEFRTEVSAIAKSYHKNLVTLLGFCNEGPHKLLVYEFMSNGTLASFIFGISRPDWNKRIQMAFGIARGLMYLHEDCSTQIIHCDIKPQNILLDESFTPRISDFGLAKLLIGDQTRTLTAIRGTKGYVAPEWFRSKPITAKVDVYSYGVMLLEIICCRKHAEDERANQEEIILTDWVYDCYKGENLDKLVENDEEARNDVRRLERLVMVAIWCIQEDPSLRPSIKMVTHMLEGVVEVSPPPCPCPYNSFC